MINPQAGVMGLAPGLAQLLAKYGAAMQPSASTPGLGGALLGQGYQMPALRSAMGQVAGPAPIPAQAPAPVSAGGYQPMVGTAANPAPIMSLGGKAPGVAEQAWQWSGSGENG